MASAPPFQLQNPFAVQPTQFLQPGEMPQAPVPQRTSIPDMLMKQPEFIDLGAGGPPPGTPRGNALSGIGGAMQQLAPALGSAMSANAGSGVTAIKPNSSAGDVASLNASLGYSPSSAPLTYNGLRPSR